MGFWENITGLTFDGLPADGMPESVKLVHSIKNHLVQLVNLPKGSNWMNPDMGIEDIPDILTSVPPWTIDFGKSLKEMIKKYDKRVIEIYFNNWHIDQRLSCLVCRIIVISDNKQIIRYRAFFSAQGSRRIEIVTGEDEEQ